MHDPHLAAQGLKQPVANSRANSSGFLATIDNEYAVHHLLRALLFADWPDVSFEQPMARSVGGSGTPDSGEGTNAGPAARINKELRGSVVTPAMAAGVANTLWSREDIAKLTEKAAPAKSGSYKKKVA